MTSYRHALADPKELLRSQRFYASAIDQSKDISRVFEMARKAGLPQLDQAQTVARGIGASPPRYDSPRSLALYLKENVADKVPGKTLYDDIFWCCLLHILDVKSVPECAIGGPLHHAICQIYDDFHPEDVTVA